MRIYDQVFYEYVNRSATRAAELVLPHLLDCLELKSVLDIGCGQGAWLAVFRRLGVPEVIGVDGDYVQRQHLLIPRERFVAADLALGFNLAERFDLVMSLEVAEHLPTEKSSEFIANLIRHGEMILFSAAPKGQGGHNHVNEQDYDFWRKLFQRHGYVAIDYLRPLIGHDRRIDPWYRYNLLLYVDAGRFARLPEALKACRVPDDEVIADRSPLTYRVRKRFVRLLPPAAMTWFATLKEKWVAGKAPW